MTEPIAIVGMACEYPDARSPAELWENSLAHRRAFRRMPAERLRVEDYYSPRRDAEDRTYAVEAALIEGYEFDRVGFRVAGSTYRSADPTHWLALDVASRALRCAGFESGEGLPREATGVFLGNTLTGEFSRADLMRLRWPYVGRVVDSALRAEGWGAEERREFLDGLEPRYKGSFAPVGEETLAGGLSNTIAGRICNHFDLKGGGYTVDGACASSLLAVANACAALASGDLDVALAGGVDLSLDPFELVGFAKVGALAVEEMRPYDARSAGFWPGEGCGILVLMRLSEARARRLDTDVVVRGWGISSDGRGGMTRPEVEGQILALRRAYGRAGFGIESVPYFEGHGTGTSVGDATELRTLGRALREASAPGPPAVISSIKANIGHTKAAAGAAGLIRASMALRAQVLPAATGCEVPHAELVGEGSALRVLSECEPWPADRPLRAGVSAMGFGGINAHVVLEGTAVERRPALGPGAGSRSASVQDAELFLLADRDHDTLRDRVARLRTAALRLSRSELSDLAAELSRRPEAGPVRAALIASRPSELADKLDTLRDWLIAGVVERVDPQAGVFLSGRVAAPRVGFLFPGQGAPAHLGGGALRRRFASAAALYDRAGLPTTGDGRATEVAQPAIVASTMAALGVLGRLGISAEVAVGHSLGELVALGWAGALDDDALLRVAAARGRAMAGLAGDRGGMVSIALGQSEVEALRNGSPNTIACLNAPRQTVVSGTEDAVMQLLAKARSRGIPATRLPVSHAFHSPMVAEASAVLAGVVALEEFRPLRRRVVSTVTGARLAPDDDLRALLCRQVTAPVRFVEAVAEAAEGLDLWIEVGPGRSLSGLVSEPGAAPVVAIDAGGPSLVGLLSALGAAFALGQAVVPALLFEGRLTRPIDPDRPLRFFANPCELAPKPDAEATAGETPTEPGRSPATRDVAAPGAGTTTIPITSLTSILELVRSLVAERADLPVSAVDESHHLLSDLHLNSIVVGQLVAESCRRLDLPAPVAPTHFANATVAEVAAALSDLARTGGPDTSHEEGRLPAGIDAWVRPFTVALVERPRPPGRPPEGEGCWKVLAPTGHPLAGPLERGFAREGQGNGVLVCLPAVPDEESALRLLEGARAALAAETGAGTRFVVVQHGGGGVGFSRSLHLEEPRITTCVIDVPPGHPEAASWVVSEAGAASGFTEVHYDATGRRMEPVLRLIEVEDLPASPVLGPTDVLLVTGGGKGIAAESALALACQSRCRLALLGRSRPSQDRELAANLARFAAEGVTFRYLAADVVDEDAVLGAVLEVESELGPVSAILHGAGSNVPQRLASLDAPALLRTLAPKVQGLRNLLSAVAPDRLRLVVSFGSIIARTGMRGEADYALANEWLALQTERIAADHPSCRCLTLEWSVWSGVGMGERLGRVEALSREGITPIPPGRGIALLRDLVARHMPTVSVVVTGRLGASATLSPGPSELPLWRFLEHPRVEFPGVEIVADVELSTATDRYLDDHVFRGDRLLPAAMGLEAMAQVAQAVAGDRELVAFEDVRFDRPVSAPGAGTSSIRVAALAQGSGRVEVAIRAAATGFQVDHFRATCRFGGRGPDAAPSLPRVSGDVGPVGELDPTRDLYGTVLFQGGRFRRLRGYRRLVATECVAEIASAGTDDWFGPYLPPGLSLGDPGARDAFIHAVQACIPHRTLLPVGVEQLVLEDHRAEGPRIVHALERSRRGDTFTYDLVVSTPDGRVCERWEGLQLRAVQDTPPRGPWPVPLLGPYLERRVGDLNPDSVLAIAVERGEAGGRRERTRLVVRTALGRPALIHWRPDGRPELPGGPTISAAHAGLLTLAVVGRGEVGCDLEPVRPRPESSWHDLLGPERIGLSHLIAREADEDPDTSATRVWAAIESLEKAGAMIRAPLVLAAPRTLDGWVVLAAGPMIVTTYLARVGGVGRPLVAAVAARRSYEVL